MSLLTPSHIDATLLSAYLSGLTEQEAARLQASEWDPSEAAEVLPFLYRDAADGFRVLASFEVALADPQVWKDKTNFCAEARL